MNPGGIDASDAANQELHQILRRQADADQEQSQAQERQMIDILCSNERVAAQALEELCFSTLLSAHDLRSVMRSHNSILGDIEQFQKRAGE